MFCIHVQSLNWWIKSYSLSKVCEWMTIEEEGEWERIYWLLIPFRVAIHQNRATVTKLHSFSLNWKDFPFSLFRRWLNTTGIQPFLVYCYRNCLVNESHKELKEKFLHCVKLHTFLAVSVSENLKNINFQPFAVQSITKEPQGNSQHDFKLHYITQLLRYGWDAHNSRLFEKGSAVFIRELLCSFSSRLCPPTAVAFTSHRTSIIRYTTTTTITRLPFLSRGILDWGCSERGRKRKQ